MKRLFLTIDSFFLVSVFLLSLFVAPSSANISPTREPFSLDPMILFVGGSGPGNYTKIQDAIENSSAGDIVFVYSGYYKENIYIIKTVHIIGIQNTTTIIDGESKGSVVSIFADNSSIQGFTIQNASNDIQSAGIKISTAKNVNIIGNIIKRRHIDTLDACYGFKELCSFHPALPSVEGKKFFQHLFCLADKDDIHKVREWLRIIEGADAAHNNDRMLHVSCSTSQGYSRHPEHFKQVRVIVLKRDRKGNNVECRERSSCFKRKKFCLCLFIFLKVFLVREKDPLAYDIRQIIQQAIDTLKAEARHCQGIPVRVAECNIDPAARIFHNCPCFF